MDKKHISKLEQTKNEAIRTTEFYMLKLMKENGATEKQIRTVARKQKIPTRTVNRIFGY